MRGRPRRGLRTAVTSPATLPQVSVPMITRLPWLMVAARRPSRTGTPLHDLRDVDLPEVRVHLRGARPSPSWADVDAEKRRVLADEAAHRRVHHRRVDRARAQRSEAQAVEGELVADAAAGDERERPHDVRGRAGARVDPDLHVGGIGEALARAAQERFPGFAVGEGGENGLEVGVRRGDRQLRHEEGLGIEVTQRFLRLYGTGGSGREQAHDREPRDARGGGRRLRHALSFEKLGQKAGRSHSPGGRRRPPGRHSVGHRLRSWAW